MFFDVLCTQTPKHYNQDRTGSAHHATDSHSTKLIDRHAHTRMRKTKLCSDHTGRSTRGARSTKTMCVTDVVQNTRSTRKLEGEYSRPLLLLIVGSHATKVDCIGSCAHDRSREGKAQDRRLWEASQAESRCIGEWGTREGESQFVRPFSQPQDLCCSGYCTRYDRLFKHAISTFVEGHYGTAPTRLYVMIRVDVTFEIVQSTSQCKMQDGGVRKT